MALKYKLTHKNTSLIFLILKIHTFVIILLMVLWARYKLSNTTKQTTKSQTIERKASIKTSSSNK